jgi:hypothetical protein
MDELQDYDWLVNYHPVNGVACGSAKSRATIGRLTSGRNPSTWFPRWRPSPDHGFKCGFSSCVATVLIRVTFRPSSP